MASARGLLTLVVVLVAPQVVRAQFFVPALAPAYPVSSGLRVAYSGRGLSVAGTFGNPYLGWGIAPFAPYGVSTTRVSIYYSPPPVAVSPPIVIQQPVVVVRERNVDVTEDAEFIRIVPRKNKLAPVEEVDKPGPDPMPGQARGNFRPIAPKDRARAEKPAPAKPAAPRRAEDNPVNRSAAFLAEGRAAFQERLHGRAERLFLAAATADAAEPTATFLVAQAQFALRKYREAVAAIEAGLRARPNWPNAPFRPEELYGANAADFKNELAHLEETLARHPNDAALLFLHGYELWFAGRQAEARAAFLRAAKVTPDRRFIELFLNARPVEPMARAPAQGRG